MFQQLGTGGTILPDQALQASLDANGSPGPLDAHLSSVLKASLKQI
jgi:hypothetical protein